MAQKNLQINIKIGLQQVQQAVNNLSQRFNLLKSSLRAVFRTAIVAGFFATLRSGFGTLSGLQNNISKLVSEMAALNLAAIKTAAVATGGGAGFSKAFEEAATMARQASTQVSFSIGKIQEGLFTAAQAGLNLADSMKVTDSAMQLATVGAEDFQNTLNNLIGITRAFGVEINQIPQFADALTAAMVNSKATLNDLFEGLRNVASISATAFGESRDTFLDASAALMTLNDAGIEGSSAGVKLRAAMQKLLGGTAQTTAAFTKYGVNLFQANAESQKFLGTLLGGQRAMASTQDAVNRLKQRQFDLVIAGKENTQEYKSLQEELDSTQQKLGNLQSGLDDVYGEFTLAGGKLKSFANILNEIKGKAPTEVIGRAFGIRGGEGIMRVLNNLDKFNRFKTILKEYVAESDKGKSITQDIFGKFLDSVLIKWQKMKNSVMAIFNVIADSLFSALGPVLEPLQMGLEEIYSSVERNKDVFTALFKGIADSIKPIMSQVAVWLAVIADKIRDIFTPGKAVTLPMFKAEGGKLTSTEKEVTGTVGEKLGGLIGSLSSLLTEGLRAGLQRLMPIFMELARAMAEAFSGFMQAKAAIWETIGVTLAGAMVTGFLQAIIKELPKIKEAFNQVMSGLGLPETATIGEGLFKFKVPLRLPQGQETTRGSDALPTSKEVAKTSLLDSILGSFFNAKPITGNMSETKSTGSMMVDFGGGMENVNLDALNRSGASMSEIFNKVERSAELFSEAVNKANSNATNALAIAEATQRQVFQSNNKTKK